MGSAIPDVFNNAKFRQVNNAQTPNLVELDYILSRTSSTSLYFYARNSYNNQKTTADGGTVPTIQPTLGAVADSNSTIETYGNFYATSWVMGGGMTPTQYQNLSNIIRAYNVATGRS